jgi:hypothetical protein
MRELGHEFAFSGEPIEFLRGIHRLASLLALDVRAKPSRDRVFERASWWLSRRDKWIRPQRRLRGIETRQEGFGSDQLVSSVAEGMMTAPFSQPRSDPGLFSRLLLFGL